MSVTKINNENFASEIKNSSGYAIVDFYADWCGPCKMLAPVIENIASEREDLKVAKINVDESSELAAAYQVMSIPTVILFKDGVEQARTLGFKSKQALLAALNL